MTALWGWPNRKVAPVSGRDRRFRVVVPAHDEESVIGGVLGDLDRSDYPRDRYEVWVLADRCTDGTVEVALAAGAKVAERTDGDPGKGAALAWYLSGHPLRPDEALVVFDADNRVPSETLGRIADEMAAGHEVVQCYLDVANPEESLIAEASALSYWAGNRMVQLARSNLGWSADLGGTGMAFTSTVLDDVGGFGTSLTEDQELGARLVLAGREGGMAPRREGARREAGLDRGGGPAEGTMDGREEGGGEKTLRIAGETSFPGITRHGTSACPARTIVRRPGLAPDDRTFSSHRVALAPALGGMGCGHRDPGA